MKLRKDQRFTAYCIMLSEVEHSHSKGLPLFLCNLWSQVINGVMDGGDCDELFADLPELLKKKPKDVTIYREPWFYTNDLQERENILKQCISETA